MGEWNTYLIETAGNRIRVTFNDTLVNDYTSTRRTNGFLALQVHGFPSRLAFRNLRIKGHGAHPHPLRTGSRPLRRNLGYRDRRSHTVNGRARGRRRRWYLPRNPGPG
ncbi:MAG: DUF1080 domain-containing protein [Pseudonocardia sp.]|nr:DUF1080 domain-containing protein [Pseudonocardia sp.]